MPHIDDSPARMILDAENDQGQRRYRPDTLSPIGKPGFKTDVADSPEIFQLEEAGGAGAVLIISNAAFPEFAVKGASQATAAAAALPAPLDRHVLAPRSTGHHDGRSYAIYPRLQPLSQNRLVQAAQLAVIRQPVLTWLSGVGSLSRKPATPGTGLQTGFLSPYRYLAGEQAIPDRIRTRACQALAAIEEGAFEPVLILQHGDFWRGNLLLGNGWPRATEGPRFFSVIDWGSSNLAGYPFIDLLRFARSTATRDQQILRDLSTYSSASHIPLTRLVDYVCAYTGHLGLNRNEFPFDRYLTAIETLFDRADRLAQIHDPNDATGAALNSLSQAR